MHRRLRSSAVLSVVLAWLTASTIGVSAATLFGVSTLPGVSEPVTFDPAMAAQIPPGLPPNGDGPTRSGVLDPLVRLYLTDTQARARLASPQSVADPDGSAWARFVALDLAGIGNQPQDESCSDDGTSGARVQAIYARPQFMPDRYSIAVPWIRQSAAEADQIFELSAEKTGGHRSIRWVTDGCVIDVANVVLPGSTWDDFEATKAALGALGYTNPDRKYLVWFEATTWWGGIATLQHDDSPAQDNLSNVLTGYARTDLWWGNGAAHELAHTLGAVQNSAPHSTSKRGGGGHCFDAYDIMCYEDAPGVWMDFICGADQAELFDCGNDDYFAVNPSGAYLASHWNIANSRYLNQTPASPAPSRPAWTFPNGALSADSVSAVHDVTVYVNLIGAQAYMVTESSLPPASDDPDWIPYDINSGWLFAPVTVPTSAGDGLKTLYLWLKDGSGNVVMSANDWDRGNLSELVTYVDSTRPLAEIHAPASTPTRQISVTVGGSDSGVGLSYSWYAVSTSNQPPSIWQVGDGTAQLTLPASASRVTIYAWTKDAAGNISDPATASVVVEPPPGPTISISDASVIEGSHKHHTVRLVFTVTLSRAVNGKVTVHFATANGTAVAGSDYLARSGTLKIKKGRTSATIVITVKSDKLVEPSEILYVNLSNALGAAIAHAQGVGTIINDD